MYKKEREKKAIWSCAVRIQELHLVANSQENESLQSHTQVFVLYFFTVYGSEGEK